MQRIVGGLLLVMLVIGGMPLRAEAVIPVIDGAAVGHLITQISMWIQDAALQVKQVANQVLQLEHMAIMVQSWALALKNLDFSIVSGIGGPLGDLMEVFAMAQGAFYNAALIKEQFDQLFEPFNTNLYGGDRFFFEKAFDWNEAQRQAHWVAAQQQAHLHINLQAGMQGLVAGLNHSRSAVGHLQAMQAGNQLVGLQVAQQMETNALLGAMSNTQTMRDLTEAAIRNEALLRLCAAMEGWSTVTSTEGLDQLPTTLR